MAYGSWLMAHGLRLMANRATSLSLLGAKRDRGIYTQRAPDRHPVREQCDEHEEQRRSRKRQRIEGADAEHQRPEESRRDARGDQTNRDANCDKLEAAGEHDAQHVAALRAKR